MDERTKKVRIGHPGRDNGKLTWNSLMDIAHGHEFVMQALLAYSSTHLARMAGDEMDLPQTALQYRVKALTGLQHAINDFSLENSDAVLAASILMQWQAPDP